jgi:hypothetical protein
MMSRALSSLAICAVLSLISVVAHAEPYLAARMGMKCVQCHVNPTGGGLRSAFGNVYANTQMPARRLLDDQAEQWTGLIGKHVAVGGNVRANYDRVDVPDTRHTSEFDLEEARAFLDVAVIPGRLSIYVDERVAPGTAENMEANVRFWMRESELYVKAGKMYLPFGWRLEDDTAFVRQVSGIGMTVPDNGVEIGWERGPYSAQLAISNGTAGGPEDNNGKQGSFRGEYVQSIWRFGASASFNDSDLGDKGAYALHGAIRTGPIVWLGEVDYIDDKSLGAAGRKQLVSLAEANWLIRQGHNLKLTYEYFEPDDDVDEDEQIRGSLVYELTPLEFLQLRVGARVYDGIPQNDLQNRQQYFVQLHGFF